MPTTTAAARGPPPTYALSMGRDDLYPFVIAPPAAGKLALAHELTVTAARSVG